METLSTEVVIAGGGLAGIVTAYELLDRGHRVLLLDKDKRENFGGLAKESFGGVHLIGTPHQRRIGVRDTPELAWQDWQSVAHYGDADNWPRQWGRFYCENSLEYIYEFLSHKRITFLPVVNWAERGVHAPGNSVPRWHIVWGTGYEIIHCLLNALEAHPNRKNLELRFDCEVSGVEVSDGRAIGVFVPGFRITAEHVVIASGGICGGDLSKVRATWYRPWGAPPQRMLNGAHIYADGKLHDRVAELGGAVTHLDLHWHYAAGIHHPAKRKPDDGLSLVPPRSALWLNAKGERIMNPGPMLSYGDTRHLVASVAAQPGQYSWQVMNWKVAIRELAVSGCDYMTAFRQKDRVRLIRDLVFGNKELVERLIRECPDDIVTADSLDELMEQMDRRSLSGLRIDRPAMERCIRAWDDMVARGPAFHNDEQLRRIANFRAYAGDKPRTCNFQRILDPKARPLIAIREFILTRKSLGGIQTDLQCRVLRQGSGAPIPGLYAVGEAAGFGGGGIHGQGSLEGTFLGGCVLSGRLAGRGISGRSIGA
jgi:predicted oxidoreductase